MSGKFIVLDGPDGGGKSTQLTILAERLKNEGYDIVATRDPGGTRIGNEIRNLLLGVRNVEMAPWAELFLFLAARAQLVDEVVRPALEQGKIVLSDRYALSTLVYQGTAGDLKEEVDAILKTVTTGIPHPDLTVVLDIPAEVGLARSANAKGLDRMERKGLEYHRSVREGFLNMIPPLRQFSTIRIVDATQSVADVAAGVWEHVQHALD